MLGSEHSFTLMGKQGQGGTLVEYSQCKPSPADETQESLRSILGQQPGAPRFSTWDSSRVPLRSRDLFRTMDRGIEFLMSAAEMSDRGSGYSSASENSLTHILP
ncbi:hypothetical protein AAFF_G00417570 [Aldrovandia affinis]|uniref:Uncharacterized protein n=1 Tax=Aldrovandia affinis TaxID=143900 RepID=A0AAD7WK07_9TELE|nr:hypothetical protein AAFF_G00417570 [Aldrovandia affinis]